MSQKSVLSLALQQWVQEMMALCQPDQVYWCDGSENEKKVLTEKALQTGELISLNQQLMPNCFLHRSDPNDVARVEARTFICCCQKKDAGITNNWMDPEQAYAMAHDIFQGSMHGRTMYIVPFCMGPLGSEFSKIGVEITDSIYVVLNMWMMTRMGSAVLETLGDSDQFTKGLHCTAQLDPEKRYILHFPEDNAIWSVNSGYGGNALLGKKCLALRIASYLGRKEQWMAEHMLILGVQYPDQHVEYIVAAFPSSCGKTNLAMLTPPKALQDQGYKIWTVGDDIAWLRVGSSGELRAVNPEYGFFGVLPGTNSQSNPVALASMTHDAMYTNVLLKPDQTVWWEGADGDVPREGVDWKGDAWLPSLRSKGAHPNSRFTAKIDQCSIISEKTDDPMGVPVSAILFGGRRAELNPLVYETFSWSHGVYVGATMCSEKTAAQEGDSTFEIRHDPMAMRPFCGYNMGDYFQHWLDMGQLITQKPKVFCVNWFRQDENGRFLWPGFGDNMWVLKWILARCRNEVEAKETPLGYLPYVDDLNLDDLDIDEEDMCKLLEVNADKWSEELEQQDGFLKSFGEDLPVALWKEHQALKQRLKVS